MRLFYLFPLLIIGSAYSKTCGLTGTIEERIKECAQTKGNFALVTVTEKGFEIYKDIKTGLIWGNRISIDFNHYGSQKACNDEVSGYELKELKWRLPTINEFEKAASHGMKEAVPDMKHAYWSSTPVKTRRVRRRRAPPARVFIWDSVEEKTDTGDLKDSASVRCVARE